MRFHRVQVQLKATKENTQKILTDLKRSHLIERLFIIDLVMSYILLCLAYDGHGWLKTDKFWVFLRALYIVTVAIFVIVFTSLMAGVNK